MRGSMKPLGDVLHSSWVVLQHQKGTKLDAAAVPASKKRLSGESTHEYLTRHEVQQSLRAAQQSAADNGGRRMSMLPRPGPEPCASGARRFQLERLGRRPQHVAGFAGTPEVGAFPGPGTAASAAHIEVARMTNGRPSPDKVHQAAQGLGISRTVANIRSRHLRRTVQRNADREARGRKISERRECCACIHRLAQRAKRHSHFVKSWIKEARAQTCSAGQSAPAFSQSAWKKMKLSIDSSQPVFHNFRRSAKAGGCDGHVRMLSVINRAGAITAAALVGLVRQ